MKKTIIRLVLIGAVLTFFIYASSKYLNIIVDYNNLDESTEEVLLSDDDVKKSIFKDYYNDAIKTVSNMTIQEKVGQLFIVQYRQQDVEYLSNFTPGGYLLFAKDVQNHTKESLKKELSDDQKLNKYGLIFAVDEEGGFVTRISRFKNFRDEKFLSPKSYYQQGGYELLEQTENEKAKLLKELGFNLNLSPVSDISTDPEDFMYERAFGGDAAATSDFVSHMVKYANNNKISSCLKHFPGYGNNVDTHTGGAIDERPYETFTTSDYLPFKAGIDAKVPCVLVSHNIVKSIDDKFPSSLSEKVVGELRNKLGFSGIIITDDLTMDAVKEYVEKGEAATLALNAGNDMIITGNFMSMYKEVLNSYDEGKISEETINKAAIRVIAWKYYNGIL